MRYLAPLLLLVAGLFLTFAADAAEIECIRAGTLPVPEKFDSAADSAKRYCAGDQADVLPVLAMGKFVTVVLDAEPECDATRPYMLLVDGMPTGIAADGCNKEQKTLSFRLSHAPPPNKYWQVDGGAVRLLWQRLLGDPWDTDDWQRNSWISVQQWTGSAPPSVSTQVPFLMRIVDISADRGIAAFLVLLGLVAVLVKFAFSGEKTLLRDRGNAPAGKLRPFSLARTQMAWWFGLIFVAYVFLWVVCAELPALSGSALVLLGIAGGTGIVGTSMDEPSRSLQPSEGWLLDVTSDAEGVTLYRLQHLVWNAFFGAAFMIQVASTLAIPEFDNSTLGLMGISAAAYLGFKVPEKKTEAHKATAAQAASEMDAKSDYGAA